jgi:hypothetical protein
MKVLALLSVGLAVAAAAGEFKCPNPNGLFQDTEDCNAYYKCTKGVPKHQSCPGIFIFNPATKRCGFKGDTSNCNYVPQN